MINIAASDLHNNLISGGLDIDTVHRDPQLKCINVHCWVLSDDGKYVLIQRRSANTWCYPNKYDISLAGHVDAGEQPLDAMLRESHEEGLIDLHSRLIEPDMPIDLSEPGCYKNDEKWEHNQRVYIYFAFVNKHEINIHPNDGEVGKFEWWSLDTFALRAINPTSVRLVPHPSAYYHFVAKKLYELRRTHAKMSA